LKRTGSKDVLLRRPVQFLLFSALLGLCAFASAQTGAGTGQGQASDTPGRAYHGIVTFGGLPLPGATVTATQGSQKFAAVSDQGGVYHFDNLADGSWTIVVEMQCFEAIHAQATIGADTQPGKWEMKLLPVDQLLASTKVVVNPIVPRPALTAPAKKTAAAGAPAEMPSAPETSNDQSAEGYLVNGSVNNAATSRFSTNPAFGNSRSGGRALYNGGLAIILDNSTTDARNYPISGVAAPKISYDLITSNAYLGGPLNIPHLLPRGPSFFVNYAWTRNNNAAIDTGLVPTLDERMGNLAGLVNAQGQPITLYNPATGMQYAGNQVPVSAQAAALLALYPQPNPQISSASGYNYQASVLNGVHQDGLQSRLMKSLGRRDQLYGGFNFQSTRAANVSLFDFVDAIGSLGMNANAHWTHRFSSHLFLFTGYTFSRLRTEITPNFANRVNISGPADADISGNDQDAADWGPPTLTFSSGIASLTDTNSEFNRSQSDGVSVSAGIYRGRHNISLGGDFRKQDFNDDFQQNPRGVFTFTGTATANAAGSNSSGSDLADFLIGIPDSSALAYGNADKYFREPVYDVFVNDDWRVLPSLTINAGMRWEYGAPMTELLGRLVNLDLNVGFTAGAPVLGTDPVGSVTGEHYPASLIRPDRRGFEPRVGLAWRPIPASTLVVRASYGIYDDTSVYHSLVLDMAQQAPFSKSLSVANSAACPLTLANGFPLEPDGTPIPSCSSAAVDTFAIDPNYRIGYAQVWQLAVQRDLPGALQLVATYNGVKGTHGAQQLLPNTNPIGASVACPGCPTGFVYRASGGNSTRQAGELQLRRRLKDGLTATLEYTYSKSIDDDAVLGGQGYVTSSTQSQNAATGAVPTQTAAIAQDWLNPRAERGLSTFDQRQLLNLTAQYTSGEGLGGGTLMNGWRGRMLKEWTLQGTLSEGTGLPETPIYPVDVPGTSYSSVIRPSVTGAPIYASGGITHLNVAAYQAPAAGAWGTAGRDSITGPNQFSLNSSLARTFRPHGKTYLDLTVAATNVLNHPEFTAWNTIWDDAALSNAQQFGRPAAANSMRKLETTLRLRF
jgi:trimeric autotransporter adhesin